MNSDNQLYSFVFRGLLAEDALDKTSSVSSSSEQILLGKVAELAGISTLGDDEVLAARKMAEVYVAIAAFENTVRQFVSSVLIEASGENWWKERVSEKIRKAAEKRWDEEAKIKWHTSRGEDPIQYTMLPNLLNIIRNNFEDFEPFLINVDWAGSIFDSVERSRNVIMHSGFLSNRDIARLGSAIKDWSSQVAT